MKIKIEVNAYLTHGPGAPLKNTGVYARSKWWTKISLRLVSGRIFGKGRLKDFDEPSAGGVQLVVIGLLPSHSFLAHSPVAPREGRNSLVKVVHPSWGKEAS